MPILSQISTQALELEIAYIWDLKYPDVYIKIVRINYLGPTRNFSKSVNILPDLLIALYFQSSSIKVVDPK